MAAERAGMKLTGGIAMRRNVLAVMTVLLLASFGVTQRAAGDTWQVTGLGGAGGMYTPTVSPFDSNLMFLSCDMSGSYVSVDGGKSWRLIHYQQLRGSRMSRPAFLDKDTVYWADEASLRVSKDKGQTWKPVSPNFPWKNGVTHIAVEPGNPAFIYVGTDEGLWSGTIGRNGETVAGWTAIAPGGCGGLINVGRFTYAAVPAAGGKKYQLLRLSGRNRARTEMAVPQAGENPILAIAAGAQGTVGPAASTTLYVIAQGVGTLRSADGGRSWSLSQPWQQQRDLLMPPQQNLVAYAAREGGHEVWRTADSGKTWQSIFHMTGNEKNVQVAWTQTFLHWDYSISHLGIGIDPRNPDVVMMTSEGDFYRSNNGGREWFQCQNDPVGVKSGDPGFRFKSTGLEVTTLWGYYFDPNNPNRQYICYTDVGFARSVDKGATWISAVQGCPWSNTFYEIAFDPYVKGRIFAACSSRHDIPHWTHLDANRGQQGGVCLSDDYGATWKVLGTGLPKLPCTSIVVDPKSPRDRLTLYAAFYEGGIYRSTDGGKTWEKKSNGLGNPGNLHCSRIRIHPTSGNVYGLITGFRRNMEFPVPGGLWVSGDKGETWRDLTSSWRVPRPTDFAVHPKDENTIYVAASTIPGREIGGIYKTTDGGKTWTRLIDDQEFAKWCPPSYIETSTINMHPDDPNLLYAGSDGHGLWYTRDAGRTWKPFESFPFSSPQNVAFEPADHKAMIVTTFGAGAWRGPYLPTGN